MSERDYSNIVREIQQRMLATASAWLARLLNQLYDNLTRHPLDLHTLDSLPLILAQFRSDVEGEIRRELIRAVSEAVDARKQLAVAYGYPASVVDWHLIEQQATASMLSYLRQSQYATSTPPLSHSLYDLSTGGQALIAAVILAGLRNGATAADLARSLAEVVLPGPQQQGSAPTGRGLGYITSRLVYTQLVSAFNQSSATVDDALPFVVGTRFSLSPLHPRPDNCNDYAAHVDDNIAAQLDEYGIDPTGVWPSADCPTQGHVNCLCTTESVVVPVSRWAAA